VVPRGDSKKAKPAWSGGQVPAGHGKEGPAGEPSATFTVILTLYWSLPLDPGWSLGT
jgi:hypothetical protein